MNLKLSLKEETGGRRRRLPRGRARDPVWLRPEVEDDVVEKLGIKQPMEIQSGQEENDALGA